MTTSNRDNEDTGRETPLAKQRQRLSSLHLDDPQGVGTSDRELILGLLNGTAQNLQLQIDQVEDHLLAVESRLNELLKRSEAPRRNEVIVKTAHLMARGPILSVLLLVIAVIVLLALWKSIAH